MPLVLKINGVLISFRNDQRQKTRNFSNRLINGTSHDYMQNRHSFCHLLDRSLHVEFRPVWSLYSTITYPCECCHLATQVLMQSVESILDDHERFWVCSIPQRNLTFFSTYRKESLSFHTALIVLLILYEGICHRNCWDRSVLIHPSLAQSDFVRPQSVELPLIPPLLRSASPLGTIYHRYWKLGGVYCVISPRSFTERERFFFFFFKSRCITVFEQKPIGCCCIFPAVCSFWK